MKKVGLSLMVMASAIYGSACMAADSLDTADSLDSLVAASRHASSKSKVAWGDAEAAAAKPPVSPVTKRESLLARIGTVMVHRASSPKENRPPQQRRETPFGVARPDTPESPVEILQGGLWGMPGAETPRPDTPRNPVKKAPSKFKRAAAMFTVAEDE